TPASLTLRGIRGVGNLLKFAEDELRNYQRTSKKTCFGNVRDSAVDDHRRIQNLQIPSRSFVTKNTAQCRKIQIIAFGCSNHQAYVCHEECEGQGGKSLHLWSDCHGLLTAN